MKYNIALFWYLFDGLGGTDVTVSPTSGNFVPKFNQRKLVRARNMKSKR